MKFSIIIPTYNKIAMLAESMSRVISHTEDFEVIVVDNGSTDGTKGYVLECAANHPAVVNYIRLPENKGFAGACNIGLHEAKGDYLILLNNDVLVTPGWASQIVLAMRRYEKASGLRIGLAGPVTNFAAGRQGVPNTSYSIRALDAFAQKYHQTHVGDQDQAGFLSGFCVILKRKTYEEIGDLDESFFPGGYEDNDILLRANLKGWYGMIDGGTFLHHYGSSTLGSPEFSHMEGGLALRGVFLDKWSNMQKGPKKLVAIYRVKDGDQFFEQSLKRTSEFVDEICVLVDNPGKDDRSEEIAKACTKVVSLEISTKDFDERRDRNTLLKMAYDRKADWVISIDADEVFEDRFTKEFAQKLMHPSNPHIKVYGFQWRTFFNGTTQFRVDDIFGRMAGFRMFKAEPGRFIHSGTDKGLHCGNIPPFPPESMRWTSLRVKHYGYHTYEECKRKFDFYQALDTQKNARLIGGEDYRHLLQEKMVVYPWKEHSTLSLVITVKNGGHKLWEVLDTMGAFVDEIILGDNGSTDDTVETAKRFGAKIVPVTFNDSFGDMKNAAIDAASGDWVLIMDSDEAFQNDQVPNIRRMLDNDCDGYMFSVYNHQRGGQISLSEAVRLFKNASYMRYTGRVHENFDVVMQEKGLKIFRTDLILHHYGFLLAPEQMDVKLDLYKRLNELQMAEDPKDARPVFNLALHYLNVGDFDKGVVLLNQAIVLNGRFYQAKKELGLAYIRAGQKWISEAMRMLDPSHPMKRMLADLTQSITSIIGEKDIVIGTGGQDG